MDQPVDNKKPDLAVFDGECTLCRYFADRMEDKNGSVSFIEFQHYRPTMEERLANPMDGDSFYYYSSSRNLWFHGADAILILLYEKGGYRRILSKILRKFPKVMRDRVYRFVAKQRHLLK